MARTVVSVLRGGPSEEYDTSLKTGAAFLAALPEERYQARDVLVDRQGIWHFNGRPIAPGQLLKDTEVALNAMHGAYGEDGTLQRILDRSGVAYTGARAPGAALAFHKVRARSQLESHGVRVPRGISLIPSNDVDTGQMAQLVFEQFAPPYVLKPLMSGASIGVKFVPTLHALPDAIADALEVFGAVLVEEFIAGREVTVGLIEHFREQPYYTLPPMELVPHQAPILDFDKKQNMHMDLHCPGQLGRSATESLESAARVAHRALGLSHYSRSDFIMHPSGAVYFLETNALPEIGEGSLFPHALDAVGSSVPELTEHLVTLARR